MIDDVDEPGSGRGALGEDVGAADAGSPAGARRGASLSAGDSVPIGRMLALGGDVIDLGREGPPWHLQFRRFAGCPVCNLHIRGFARSAGRLQGLVREVILFHSPADELAPHVSSIPFPVVADADKRLYRAFGVEAAPRALLDPRAWPGIVRAIAVGIPRVMAGRDHLPAAVPAGGRLGLPADFLIAPSGIVLAAHYGRHADDQWSVDDVLALAAAQAR